MLLCRIIPLTNLKTVFQTPRCTLVTSCCVVNADFRISATLKATQEYSVVSDADL